MNEEVCDVGECERPVVVGVRFQYGRGAPSSWYWFCYGHDARRRWVRGGGRGWEPWDLADVVDVSTDSG